MPASGQAALARRVSTWLGVAPRADRLRRLRTEELPSPSSFRGFSFAQQLPNVGDCDASSTGNGDDQRRIVSVLTTLSSQPSVVLLDLANVFALATEVSIAGDRVTDEQERRRS